MSACSSKVLLTRGGQSCDRGVPAHVHACLPTCLLMCNGTYAASCPVALSTIHTASPPPPPSHAHTHTHTYAHTQCSLACPTPGEDYQAELPQLRLRPRQPTAAESRWLGTPLYDPAHTPAAANGAANGAAAVKHEEAGEEQIRELMVPEVLPHLMASMPSSEARLHLLSLMLGLMDSDMGPGVAKVCACFMGAGSSHVLAERLPLCLPAPKLPSLQPPLCLHVSTSPRRSASPTSAAACLPHGRGWTRQPLHWVS